VSATMTKAVKRLAEAQLPQLMRLEAAGFHKPTAGALQEFRVLPPGGDKMQMLMELLQVGSRAAAAAAAAAAHQGWQHLPLLCDCVHCCKMFMRRCLG